MILITLGSQKFQFNRLLKEIDKLIELNIIKDEVFAQIGYSDYIPKNFRYKKFLDREEFINCINECDKIITHGGTGAIITALKHNKKVIAIPRLAKHGEHVDDHQTEIVNLFTSMQMIESILDVEMLKEAIENIDFKNFKQFISNTENVLKSIEEFLIN